MKTTKCAKCGKEIPCTCKFCMECSEGNLRRIFKKNPAIKDAFKVALEEMREPENINAMVQQIVRTAKILSPIIAGDTGERKDTYEQD